MTGGKSRPIRSCVGCGSRKDKRELIRVVRCSDGSVTLDRTGRMNGRGAYVCPDETCLAKAHRSRALERSLKTAIDQTVYESLQAQLGEQ